MNWKYIRYGLYTCVITSGLIFAWLLVNPILFGLQDKTDEIDISAQKLREHVEFLTLTDQQRDHTNIKRLDEVADYIYKYFESSNCDEVEYQKFEVEKKEYKNVICRFNGKSTQKIIIGGHYDVDGDKPGEVFSGADDNASGTAGVLELAQALGQSKDKLNHSIELVAYTLEELPYFAGEHMGSYIHAQSLKDSNEDILFMVSLEMIGYFSEEKIQEYPIMFLSRLYPSRGNFIGLIGKIGDGKIRELKKNMMSYSDIDIWSLSSPNFIQAVTFSDHRNYWNLGYRAYMITDTSFLRNKNYHTTGDTIDTLDFDKMKEVVNGVYGIVIAQQ